ncbi:hypothetical protein vseg_008268 [Gypsophila vaccaria]
MADDPTTTTIVHDTIADDVVSSFSDDEIERQQQQQQPLNDVVSPSPSPPPSTAAFADTYTPASFTVALAATPERKPIDDSRRLFQRLWTDEDEIELLRGYLEYTGARGGGGGGHHHDTTAFYDQIKNKLQLEFNKNQLVEKLRRLKKKYRNVVAKMSSGKEFVFKSPHDHATFEFSRRIWSNFRSSNVDFDHNTVAGGDAGGGLTTTTTRKRFREPNDDDNNNFNFDSVNNTNNNDDNAVFNAVSNDFVKSVGVSSQLQVFVEETIKNCLSPVLKDLVSNAAVNQCTTEGGGGGGGEEERERGSVRVKGVGELALNAMPLHFPRGGMDDKWRKQQIIELEVYSKRLHLVQDQIKSALDELRSIN